MMKIKIGKTLIQIFINGTINFLLIILLSIILCGQSYAQWAHWENTNFPDTAKVNTIVTKDSSIFVGTNGDGIFVSTNNGEDWKSINVGLQSMFIHSILIIGKSLRAGQARIFAGTETGVSVSTDNGESWRSINSGLSGLGVWSLADSADPAGDTTIFAGAWSGVYSSTDWGETWEVTGLSSTTAPVKSILIYGNIIEAATFSEGIFFSHDNGLTWKHRDVAPKGTLDYFPIPVSAPIYSISLLSGLGQIVNMIGTIGGIYWEYLDDTNFVADTSFAKFVKQEPPILCFASRNDTLFTALDGYLYELFWRYYITRTPTYPGYPDLIDTTIGYTAIHLRNISWLGSRTIYSLALNNTYIFAVTEEGIWRFRFPGLEAITGVESSQKIPAGFVLEQNYPNPFNPATTIRYNIPKAADVTLKVYDILGNVVQTLVNKEQQPGSYIVQFAAGSRRLSSGVYFYRLQAGSFLRTKKMILLQ